MASSSEELQKLAAPVLVKTKELLARSDWASTYKEGGLEGWSLDLPGSPIQCVRAAGPLDISAKEAAERLWALRFPEWNAYDPGTTVWEIVEEFSPTLRVLKQVAKMPWPLWDRDMCLINSFVEENGAYYWIVTSCSHPKAPEDPAKYVRANILISMFGFFPISEKKCKAERILQVDPMGFIPAPVVNASAKSTYEFAAKLKKQFQI